MKTILLSAVHLLLCFNLLMIPGQIAAQAGQIAFTAHMSGEEEVPAVTTNAEGLLTILFSADRTKMLVHGLATGLSGPVTAAHLHAGNFGQNGGVYLDLSSIRTGNKFAGVLSVPADFLQKALKFGLYANVHTAAHPGGEIRGQLTPENDQLFNCTLSGASETPPVVTSAIGVGGLTYTLGYNMLHYTLIVSGLSGPITASHIHEAAIGVAGPVVAPLSFTGNRLVGDLDLSTLPSNFLSKLLAGQYYVNVHTAANPGGEVRGQLLFSGFLDGFAALNGDQETPPVITNASGFGFAIPTPGLDSVLYAVLVNGLSGPATAAHVHKGAGQTAGPVQFALTAVAGVPGFYTATAPITGAMLTDFLANNWYFNVHTAANPNGEVRGQIQTNLRKSYTYDLCGAQENPPVTDPAYGAAIASIDQGNLSLNYQLVVDGLSGPATAAHFHTGFTGTNGGVKFAIDKPTPFSEGSIVITGNDAVLVEDGSIYMNVHTTANPGGEIRGQVRRSLGCSSASAVFDPAIQNLEIFPNPFTDRITVRLDCLEAFTGQLRLTDVSGRTAAQQTVSAAGTGLQEWSIPAQNLAPGMYYLHLERLGRTVLVQTVVKM